MTLNSSENNKVKKQCRVPEAEPDSNKQQNIYSDFNRPILEINFWLQFYVKATIFVCVLLPPGLGIMGVPGGPPPPGGP